MYQPTQFQQNVPEVTFSMQCYIFWKKFLFTYLILLQCNDQKQINIFFIGNLFL